MDQLSLFSTEEILKVEDGKTCTKCNKYLPFSAFHKDASGYALGLRPDIDRIARTENFVEDGKIDSRRD